MKKSSVIGVLLLSGFLLAGLFTQLEVLPWHPQITQAAVSSHAPAGLQATDAYTVYVPLIAAWYDPTYVNPFGVTMYGSINDNAGLQIVADAGARWATTSLSWAAIEPTPGEYNWSSFDVSVQNAQAAGVELFVLIRENPEWAAPLPGGPVEDLQDLVNFATALAERYDGDGIDDAPGSPIVNYWSFYAEPDNGDYERALAGKGYWGHNGAGYAEMLSHVASAMHAANPDAQILIGGLAYDYFEEDGGPFVRSFLDDTLTALNNYPGGATQYIDAIAFHFYPTAPDTWATIREKTAEIQSIMNAHNVGNLPLICPEMGYWSSPRFGSSLDNQANRLVQMFTRALSMDMQPLMWYKVYDAAIPESADDVNPDRTAGLLDVEGDPKPAYYAFQTMTTELRGAHYLRELNLSGIEGYVFRLPTGREVTVLWATKITNDATTVTFPYTCVRRVETTGTEYSPIYDGDPHWDWDGAGNGRITLGIHEENRPIYVMPCP